ncbi:hypothetical protein [Fulvivirga sp. M361]|nr:hypothetical protein [Fulvivirga sp. M361]
MTETIRLKEDPNRTLISFKEYLTTFILLQMEENAALIIGLWSDNPR